MEQKTRSSEDIPALITLEVDWNYEPENLLGKRKDTRINRKNLLSLTDSETIPVVVRGQHYNQTGELEDLSPGGIGLIVDAVIPTGAHVKVTFFLGNQKISTDAVVSNINISTLRHRIGLKFLGLSDKKRSYITELIPSKMFKDLSNMD